MYYDTNRQLTTLTKRVRHLLVYLWSICTLSQGQYITIHGRLSTITWLRPSEFPTFFLTLQPAIESRGQILLKFHSFWWIGSKDRICIKFHSLVDYNQRHDLQRSSEIRFQVCDTQPKLTHPIRILSESRHVILTFKPSSYTSQHLSAKL